MAICTNKLTSEKTSLFMTLFLFNQPSQANPLVRHQCAGHGKWRIFPVLGRNVNGWQGQKLLYAFLWPDSRNLQVLMEIIIAKIANIPDGICKNIATTVPTRKKCWSLTGTLYCKLIQIVAGGI
jgi:hypothetical protein